MSAPSESPEWATSGANVNEPPSGKRAAGWVPGEAPPAQWLNWWQRAVGRWIVHIVERIDGLTGDVGEIPTDVARLHIANTFDEPQTIAAESGLWDLQLTLGNNLRLYSSANPGAALGGFGIAYNARWVTDHWEAQNPNAAFWLSMNYGNVYIAAQKGTVAGGPATWTAWPAWALGEGLGDLFVGRSVFVGQKLTASEIDVASGDVHAETVHVDAELTAQSVEAIGEIKGDHATITNAATAAAFLFPAAVQTWSELNLALAISQLNDTGLEYEDGQWFASVANITLEIPLVLPAGAILRKIRLLHRQDGFSATEVNLRVSSCNWASLAASDSDVTHEDFAADTIPIVSGWRRDDVLASLGAGIEIDRSKTYTILWKSSAGRLKRVRVGWDDPGPSKR